MTYISTYLSPLGPITLASTGDALTGLWIDGQKYDRAKLDKDLVDGEVLVLNEAKRWLDLYFQGNDPGFMPKLQMKGSDFQMAVWEILRKIPYGQVITYGEIAKQIAKDRGLARMSAQAVGGAVGHNPISIIVPCHRVVGSNNSLTGYAGGIDKKISLLKLEKVDVSQFFVPVKGTAL